MNSNEYYSYSLTLRYNKKMIIIEEKDKNIYPTIWKNLTEYKLQKYLEDLYLSILEQFETQRYYKMKFSNIHLPSIKKEDVLNRMEKFLIDTPKIFAQDMQNFCQ